MTRAVPFAVALLVLWGCGSNTTETSGSDIDGSSVPDAQAVYEPDVPPDEGSAADLSNDEGPDEGIDAGEMGGDGGVDVDESDQGPDPAETDSDGDGLTDAEEIADGTDRNDPRSARAWHPDVRGHPRLFFGPDDVAGLSARAGTPAEGPDQALWDRIEALVARDVPDWPEGEPFRGDIADVRSQIAAAGAFVALVRSDRDAAVRAARILAEPHADPMELASLNPLETKYDLREADALVGACAAWDYLNASGLVDADLLDDVRIRVVARIDAFRELHFRPGAYRALLVVAQNNHAMKVQGALGLCAMAFPDRLEAAVELSEALTGLTYLLHEFQGNAAGGYAEGWNYLSYGDQTWLPFLVALHRWLDGGAASVRGLGLLTPGESGAGEARLVRDPAVHPTTRAIYETALLAAQPDGLTPPVDDANSSALHGAAIAWLLEDPRFGWNWRLPAVGFAAARLPSLSFALHDPAVDPVEPAPPFDLARPEAGFVVMREHIGPDSSYLLMQVENGPMRANGLGHEQADPLSFLLHAHGEPLIIDPGYINWEHHGLVKDGRDHNLVLVDGRGPSFPNNSDLLQVAATDDAFLEHWDDDPDHTTALGRSAWEGVTVLRRIVRVDQRFFLVADTLDTAEPGAEHEYTFQLNGLGGADTPDGTFEVVEQGGAWHRGGASMIAAVASTAGTIAYSWRPEEHVTTWGRWATHACLEAEATMGACAGFLAALVPVPAGEIAPEIAIGTPGSCATSITVSWPDGRVDVAVLHRGESALSAPSPAGPWDAAPGLAHRSIVPDGPASDWHADMAPP